MSAEVIRVRGRFGGAKECWRATSVVRSANGLAITKCMERGGAGWVITHVRSGLALGLADGMIFDSVAAANEAFDSLLLLGDWRKSEGQLQRDAVFCEIGDLLCKSIAAEACR